MEEEKVSKSIRKEDFICLSTLISNGFKINKGYKYPLGCVSLQKFILKRKLVSFIIQF
jgi:hypothetical protein